MGNYAFLSALPLSYFVLFTFFIKKFFYYKKATIFLLVFTLISFFRFVILPITMVIANYSGGRSLVTPRDSSFDIAVILMIFELLVSFLLIRIMERRIHLKNLNQKKLELKLGGRRNLIFILFIVLSLIFLLFDNRWLLVINFFQAQPLIWGDDLPIEAMFGSYLFMIVKQMLFVFGIFYFFKSYQKNKSPVFLVLAITITVLNIGIFMGTNRADVLVGSFAALLLLFFLFPLKNIKIIAVAMVIGIMGLLTQISETRNFSAYSAGKSNSLIMADNLQAYLGGPYNVAIAIETKSNYPQASNIEVLFFDIFRPMLGVNFLVRDLPLEYSNIYFNRRMFLADHPRSQIIPMIGQGNLFFGYFFSPLFNVIFILLAYWFTSLALKRGNLMLFYFLILTVIRMSFMMGQNTMNLINDMSFNLFLFIIIFHLNKIVSINN